MSNNKTAQEEAAYQEQWDETKQEFQSELDVISKDYVDKKNEYDAMQADPKIWNNTPIGERANLLGSVNQARNEVVEYMQYLADAWSKFLAENPDAIGSVKF